MDDRLHPVFASMPMCAVYGLLTAVVIAMPATATLLVLPSLLVAITRDGEPQDAPGSEPQLVAT